MRTYRSLPRRPLLAGALVSAVVLVAALMFPASGAMASAGAAPLLPAAGQYFPVTPIHALDTRNGTGGVPAVPVAAHSSVTFPVTAIGDVPDGGVSAVYVVLNAIGPTANGCLDDFNPDAGDTGICTATFDAGNNDTDSDIVQVSASGDISVSNNSSGTVDVVVTVMGYYQDDTGNVAGDTYVPLPLDQIVQTGLGIGAPKAQIPAGGTLTVQVTGLDGVPSDAAGAALYIGAKNATATGDVSAYPAGGTGSSLSLLSYVPGQAVRDLYFGALSSSGQLTLQNHGSGPVDLFVAIQGYLVSPTGSEAGSAYQAVSQYRLADTRNGTGGVQSTPVQPGQSVTFAATGVDGIPQTGVSAVAETVVAINPTAVGFLSEYAAGTADPGQPGVNFYSGGNQGSGLTASLVSSVSPTGRQTITNHSTGTVDIAVTVRGYYAVPTAPGAPTEVDAGIQNGTATIIWAPSSTDGGAAVTANTVTVYNSDGSVNQTVSAAGSATSATAGGLNSNGTYTVGVRAINAVGSSPASATASVQAIPSGWTDPGTVWDSYDLEMSVDPSTGAMSLTNATTETATFHADGTLQSDTVNSNADTSAATNGIGLGSFQCVIKGGSGIVAHPGFHNTLSKPDRKFDWYHEAYSEANARTLAGATGRYKTFQDMMCSAGGGESFNGFHQWFDGTAVTLDHKHEYEIGHTWGTGQTNGTVATTLSFSLSAGPASIGASVGIVPGHGDYKGSIQEDPRIGVPSTWNAWQKNEINTFFISAHRFPWNGTSDYEGNTSQVLYEWTMGSTQTFHIYTRGAESIFCADVILGCS